MTDYLTEQEQVELLKNWIKQYSLVILAGVASAVLIVTGWRHWEQRQAETLRKASVLYNEILSLRAQNEASGTQAQKLFSTYPHTIYAQMSAFMLARDALVSKDIKEAEKQLNWIIQHSKVPAFRQIARLRLARIMIAENKAEQSIAILKKVEDKSFSGLIDEIKGDAYLAMKNPTMARQSYQAALNELPNAESVRPLLQMKFENLTTISSI